MIAGLAWALSGDPVRALAVLVVATPCPLILAAPIALVCGVSRAARAGVVVKGPGAIEQPGDGLDRSRGRGDHRRPDRSRRAGAPGRPGALLAIARLSVRSGMGLSLIAMVAAALGHIPPIAGALLQEGIDVAVILNALRALRG